jgi:hypothetical protein
MTGLCNCCEKRGPLARKVAGTVSGVCAKCVPHLAESLELLKVGKEYHA